MRSLILGLMLLACGLSGCQCCRLTNCYANTIDCIVDKQHHFEVLYCPGCDLNRIGRSDWCSYPINRLCCRCACERRRPAPCGYEVTRETGAMIPHDVSQPEWAEEELPPEAAPIEAFPGDPESDFIEIPNEAEAEKDLLLP